MITIIFGRAAQFLLALVTMRVATTFLSPEEMGRVAIVLTTTAFFALFLVNPVGMFINRRLHAWHATGVAWHYLLCYTGYLLMVAALTATGLTCVWAISLVHFGVPLDWLLFLVCGSLFFNTINQTTIPSLNLLGESRKFVLLTVATNAASFVCALLLVLMVQPSAQYWLTGLLLGQALLGAIGTKSLYAYLQETGISGMRPSLAKIRLRHVQALYRFSWPVAFAAGLGWIQGQGYRYFMESQLGLAQLGIFVAGYGISAGMLACFESVLTTYFQPRLYRDVNVESPDLQAKAWQRYAAAIIPSLFMTVAFIVVLAPELTRVFLGERFQAAADFVFWGALAETTRILVGIYSLIAHVYMRTKWLILPGSIGAGLSIILCVLLIPILGAHGVGMGLAIAGLAAFISMQLLLAPRVGGGVPLRPLLLAGAAGGMLWWVAVIGRHLMAMGGWTALIGILFFVGSVYIGAQYLFLRRHLLEKENM